MMATMPAIGRARRRSWVGAVCAAILLTVSPGVAGAAGAAPELEPTATCPEDAVAELSQTIAFVRGQTWAKEPGSMALNISPDLDACRVVLNIGKISDEEEAALQAGGGSRLAIEQRRDWAKPSRVLLILWVVFGGSGLVWLFRRYARS